MITAPEVARGLYGAWRLARLDPNGIDLFGDTAEAFWRSFYAMLIAAPGFVILVALRLSGLELTSGPVHIVLVEAISYVVGWFAFPFVMLYVVDQIDRRERFFRYIAAYNWAVVLQIALLLAVNFIVLGFAMPAMAAGYLGFATTVAVLVYWWFIARVGLGIGGGAAAAIASLDLGLSFVLSGVTIAMLR